MVRILKSMPVWRDRGKGLSDSVECGGSGGGSDGVLTDGWDESGVEGVFTESEQNACLSHSGVTDE